MIKLTEVFQIVESPNALRLSPKRVELLKDILMQKVDEFGDSSPEDVPELEAMLKELGVNR